MRFTPYEYTKNIPAGKKYYYIIIIIRYTNNYKWLFKYY